MRNWIGQDIEVDSVVGRGARDGNSSSFKFGRVLKVNEDKNTVQVQWMFHATSASSYTRDQVTRRWADSTWLGFMPYAVQAKGTCSVETVFLLAEEDLARAARLAEFHKEISERNGGNNPVSKEEFDARMEELV